MEAFINYLGLLSVIVAVFIVFTHLIYTLSKNRYTTKWRYYIWLILAIRLLIPLDISLNSLSINVVTIQESIRNKEVEIDENFQNKSSEHPFDTFTKEQSNNIENITSQYLENAIDKEEIIKTENTNVFRTLSNHQIAFILWLSGVFAFIGIDILKYCLFKRRLLRWRLLISNAQYNEVLLDSLTKMNMNKKIKMYVSRTINTPMLAGIFKPSIYIPHENYCIEELEIIIRHELIHYKRHDLHYKLLLMFAKDVHWFNPFVHFMVNEANKDLEFICDEEVVKNKDFGYKERYTKIILESAKTRTKSKVYLATGIFGGVKTMKRRFTNILNERQYKKGYRFIAGIVLLLIMSNLFISCDKKTSSMPEISESDNTKSRELWELPEKDEELAKRIALRKFGADMPHIEYASDKIAVISDYWGIAIYDIEKETLCRVLDLISIDMSATQGDSYRELLVNKEGTHIIIKRIYKNPENPVPNYLYDIEKNKLEITQKEDFEKYADNIFSTHDEEVKNSLRDINLDVFYYNIAKIGTDKWLGLKYTDGLNEWHDMRSLKIYVFDDGKVYNKQIFDKYNDLAPWPTDSEIVENHLNYIKDGKRYGQAIGFEGMSEEEVMRKFKEGNDWKLIATEDKIDKYMKKIGNYDVLIGIWTSTNTNTNETYLNVRVY